MPFDEEKERDLDLARVYKHVEDLAGKFEAVQVFASRHDLTSGRTVSVSLGSGNMYARRGQVIEWLTQQDEISRDEMREYEDGDEQVD